MVDLLIQHLLNRIADYVEINHCMRTASSKWDRYLPPLFLVRQLSIVVSMHICVCLVVFLNIANNLDCKTFWTHTKCFSVSTVFK